MPRTMLPIIVALLLAPLALLQAAEEEPARTTEFRPGAVWLDTAGRPINAHGGGMLFHEGTYYWYGENKEGRTWLPPANKDWDGYRVAVTGIRCYSSQDLLNWKDEGLVLKAVPEDPKHDLHPSKICERPKVVFSPRTKKFVMWMHIDSEDYKAARAGVATADRPTGPFTYLESVRPEGQDSRDQTLFQDDDGKAYRIYSSENNDTTYISLLTDDYLRHSGTFARVFVQRRMEAHVVFKHAGKYWFMASDCTGWDPNPARSAVADSIWGPWKELGNPCRGPGAEKTFGGQSTFVFPVAGRTDTFIFMADRWNKTNLPDSRYLWLPLRFNNEGFEVIWQDAWRLDSIALDPAGRIDPLLGTADPCNTQVWYDGRLLLLEGKGWDDTESYYDRLPARAKDKVRPPVWDLSHHSAGMCLRFLTEATSIRIRWTLRRENLAMPHMPATGVSGVDLYMRTDGGRWTFVQNGRPTAKSNEASFRVTPGAECLLYLPLYNGVESLAIGVPKDKSLSRPKEPPGTRGKPIVFYGTSITQGGCASRPGLACTTIVGRQLDVPVINLGFSGNGRMEPEMADLLAELDPAVYVLDCLWNMRPAEVSERVASFVRRLREARPGTPILLVEDSSVSNTTPTEKGTILGRIYEDLKAAGIGNLHFLSNRDMLGTDGDGTVDGCHPNDLGMMRQAIVFSRSLAAILGMPTH